ncbi:MAG: HD domain-containing protein [Candidatus Wildermuthbacteria bacterium]|nr:HD domain-containing protein [Candidatus Wildermuthbacteria bacterium]
MQQLLKFFLEASLLKTTQRTGWVWRGISNPETVAEHSFRLAFFAWVLGRKANLNTNRLIKLALLHDICEVYAGDLTPHYGTARYKEIIRSKEKRGALLKRWIRLPRKEKIKAARLRFLAEKHALLQILRFLPREKRQELLSLWIDFEKGRTAEGRFVKQLDKIEVLLQAIEYFGVGQNTFVTAWWEEAEELVEHPALRSFLKALEQKLYYKEKTEMDPLIDFLMQIGKLKRAPLYIWVLRKVKNPDSVANHIFMLALMVWLLSREEKRVFDAGRVIKIALCSGLYAIHQPVVTSSYAKALVGVKTEKAREELLKKWIRYSVEEKKAIARERYSQERLAVQRLVSSLGEDLQKEIIGSWSEYRDSQTSEARFANQVYVLELLTRALQYWTKDKDFPIKAWWEWAFERSDTQQNLQFMAALKKKFYVSSRVARNKKERGTR